MKRGVFDLLRRGFDNTVANWQLSLIRFLEALVFMAIAIGAAIALIVPILLSIGIHLGDMKTPADFEPAIAALLSKWVLMFWIVIGISVLLLVFLLIHSFVEAGCARVFVDGDRIAGPEIIGPRMRYRVFSYDRWLAGGKEGWWAVFWIYNAIWGLAGLLMLIPLLPTLALVVVFRSQEAAPIIIGCLGLLVTLMLMIFLAFVAGMWGNRSIVSWAMHRTTARHSMAIAWQALKTDLGRHLLITFALIVVGMAGSTFLSSFSFFAGFAEAMGKSQTFVFMTLPLRLVGSLLNAAFSAALGSWYLASYTALALDAHKP